MERAPAPSAKDAAALYLEASVTKDVVDASALAFVPVEGRARIASFRYGVDEPRAEHRLHRIALGQGVKVARHHDQGVAPLFGDKVDDHPRPCLRAGSLS